VIGLVVVNVVRPGEGMNIDARRRSMPSAGRRLCPGGGAQKAGSSPFLLNIIPDSFFGAFTKGHDAAGDSGLALLLRRRW
jgi:aerobic C4-dicarboxylate transport protein